MLVLTRSPDEGITLIVPPGATETRIEVKVLEIRERGDRARIGIAAPHEVVVLRNEILPRYDPPRNANESA